MGDFELCNSADRIHAQTATYHTKDMENKKITSCDSFNITAFYLNIFFKLNFSCDFKAELLASLFQSQDPSEIILIF